MIASLGVLANSPDLLYDHRVAHISFNPAAEGRYDRQRLVEWWDQDRLASSRVIVVGAGALGNEVLKLLALLGVGQILVVDFDVVARSNLARMVLFREADVGRPKVAVAVERVRELNPEVQIRGVEGDLRFAVGLAEYRRADLVFGCLDSVNARWALNRRCQRAGVTWIDGGISDFHGQVTHYAPGEGACYECTFSLATYERFNRRYSCPYGLLGPEAENKVPTTAVTTSLTAALQVQEGLMALHGLTGQGLAPGERLSVYLKPYRMLRDRLPYNPECLAHDPLPAEIASLNGDWRERSIRELIAAAQSHLPGAQSVALGFDLLVAFDCPACGTSQAVLRPKEQVRHAEARCPQCGELRLPQVTAEIVQDSPLADHSLAGLEVPPGEILAFCSAQEQIYLEIK